MADYVFHAAEGQYPINDLTPPLLQTDFRRPYPASLWRIDESNGGYPYTDLQLGVIYAAPPVPPPPEPESDPVIFVQYDIYCDNQLMHSSVVPAKEWKVIDPVLDLQDSAAGSLEFSLPKFNSMYGKCQMMMSTISVRRNGVEIWEGRPVSFKEDMWLNHAITCEGELAYLNDIYQPQNKYENVTLQQLIYAIIGVTDGQIDTTKGYNQRAAANRRFNVSYVETDTKYESDLLTVTIPFQTTLETINNICKTYGLHVYMDNVWNNGVKERRLKFKSTELGQNPTQTIEFGRNLVEYAKSYNFSELVTYVLPLGAKSTKAGATVKDNDETIDVKAAGFDQGTITSDGDSEEGDTNHDKRVRSHVYLAMPSGADSIKVTATGDSTLNVALVVYGSNKTTQLLNTGWKASGYPFDVSTLQGAAYYRIVIKHDNDSVIVPSNVSECKAEISKTRKGTPVGTNSGMGYVIWPKDGYDSRDDSYFHDHHSHNPEYFHKAGDIVSLTNPEINDYGTTPEERNKHYVVEYVITEENSTVFITTKMNNGAGMAVVHNDGNHYYIKKAGSSSVQTTWSDLKFNGWYSKYTGTTKMYVAGYETAPTVVNSKVVDQGLEEYVTVESISTNPDASKNNVVGMYVRDTDDTQYTDHILPETVYGRIERKIEWPDAKDASTLYNNAISYLRSGQFDGMQITLTALDMSMLGFKATYLRVGELVQCKCGPYGLNKPMPVKAAKIPLDKPEQTKYTVGSKRDQSLTSVNSATNSELLSLISEKPSMSSVLSAAKSSAAEYLMDTQNGYVTMRYSETGHPEAIIISDTEDYRQSPTGYWLFGKNGLGFIKPNGGSEEQQSITNCAMTRDGKIVADMMLTGTMLADRIKGGTMALGYWPDESGTYRSGGFTVRGASGNTIMQVDDQNYVLSKEDTNTNANWIKVHDHRITFGKDNDGESNDDSRAHIIGGDPVQGSSKAIGIHCDRLLFGSENIWVRTWSGHSTSGSNPYYYAPSWYPVSSEFQELRAGNYSYVFFQGILIESHNIGSSYPDAHFKVGDTTYYFEDGLLVRTETDSNNNE